MLLAHVSNDVQTPSAAAALVPGDRCEGVIQFTSHKEFWLYSLAVTKVTCGRSQDFEGSATMLAEIFMLQLEAQAREVAANKPAPGVGDPRFVPIWPTPLRSSVPTAYADRR
jgi:hypothetical protein